MTIAACAVTPEGVVFGADSTSTMTMPDGSQRYLNNEQKCFEVGERGTLGIVTWGLGRLGDASHRTRIAQLDDDIMKHPPSGVQDVAARFASTLWPVYDQTLRADIDRDKGILADPTAKPDDVAKARASLDNKGLGFCIGGHWLPDREPYAFEINFHSGLTAPPIPTPVRLQFWGANLFVFRVLGVEASAAQAIMASGKWSGSQQELEALVTYRKMPLTQPLPLRETVDVVHALLHMTIKVMKFTSIPPVCGGHIELAAITTDRRFRWIRHKPLGAALDVSYERQERS
jgi:hypothetical protein